MYQKGIQSTAYLYHYLPQEIKSNLHWQQTPKRYFLLRWAMLIGQQQTNTRFSVVAAYVLNHSKAKAVSQLILQ